MAFARGPKFENSGLMFCIDAANPKSYSGAGTTVNDISGKASSITLVCGPTFNSSNNGYFVFDGVDDYANVSVSNLSNIATIEMWTKVLNFSNQGMLFGWNTYDVWTGNTGLLGFNTGNGDLYGLSAANVTSLGLLNNWTHYIFEMRSDVSYTNNKIYINSVSQTLAQQVGTESVGQRSFNSGNGRISGWRTAGGYHSNIQLSLFRVYNRALSQAEITTNFNAIKNRYYITPTGGGTGGGIE